MAVHSLSARQEIKCDLSGLLEGGDFCFLSKWLDLFGIFMVVRNQGPTWERNQACPNNVQSNWIGSHSVASVLHVNVSHLEWTRADSRSARIVLCVLIAAGDTVLCDSVGVLFLFGSVQVDHILHRSS